MKVKCVYSKECSFHGTNIILYKFSAFRLRRISSIYLFLCENIVVTFLHNSIKNTCDIMLKLTYFHFEVKHWLFMLSSYVRSKYSIILYDFLSLHDCVAKNP